MVLDVLPLSLGQLALGALVQLVIGLVRAQPLAEQKVPHQSASSAANRSSASVTDQLVAMCPIMALGL